MDLKTTSTNLLWPDSLACLLYHNRRLVAKRMVAVEVEEGQKLGKDVQTNHGHILEELEEL
jgi:hypothetical protein